MRKKLLLIIAVMIFLSVHSTVQAQDDFPLKALQEASLNTSVRSPELQLFKRYADISSSGSDGTTNISIPLYEIELKGKTVPISINYNTSGIKVDEVSSPIGLGWQLNAGGYIIREVKGMADGLVEQQIPAYGTRFLLKDANEREFFRKAVDASVPEYDTQADIFTFNVMGHKGKFILNGNRRECILTNYDQFGGISIRTSVNGFKDGFTIQTSDGFKYEFVEKEMQYIAASSNGGSSTPIYGPYGSNVCLTWHLTKITTPQKEEIIFKYKQSATEFFDYNESANVSDNVPVKVSIPWEGHYIAKQVAMNYSKNYINGSSHPSYISEILFPNGRVIFNLSGARKDLESSFLIDNMKILDNDNKIIKDIIFNQDYFVSTKGENFLNKNYNSYKYRLKLNSIKINDELYQFKYNTTPLPIRYSFAKDWLGYYNGKDGNPTLLPKYALPLFNKSFNTGSFKDGFYLGDPNTSRNYSIDYMQSCMLTQVYYPTGGYTHYSYENHKVNLGNGYEDLGGLRIKKIVNYTSDNKFQNGREFEYGNCIVNGFISTKEIVRKHYISIKETKLSCTEIQYSTTNIFSDMKMLSNNGPLANYREIKEIDVDAQGISNGYSVSKYDFKNDEITSQSAEIIPYQFTDNSIYRGNLTEKSFFDKTGKIQKANKYSYQIYNSQNGLYSFIAKRRVTGDGNCDTDKERAYRYTYFWTPLNELKKYISTETEISYTDKDSIITEKQYSGIGMNGGHYINYIKTTTSNASVPHYIKYKYPEQGYLNGNQSIEGQLANAFYYPVLEESYLKGSKLINYKKIEYKKENELLVPNVLYEGIINTETEYENAVNIIFNNIGNPTSYKQNNQEITLFWSYNGQYPMFEVNNATYAQLESALGKGFISTYPESYHDEKQVDSLIDQIQTKIPSVQIKRYQYPEDLKHKPLINNDMTYVKMDQNNNPIEVINSKGENIVYIWGVYGKYPVIEIKGLNYDKVYSQLGYHIDHLYEASSPYSQVYGMTNNLISENKGSSRTWINYPTSLPIEKKDENGQIIKYHIEPLISFDKYDIYGNLVHLKDDKKKLSTTIIWSYNGQHPVAEIKNATYDDVEKALGTNVNSISKQAIPDMVLINGLRSKLSNALITTYTYKPLVGMLTSTDPSGITTYYEYDSSNRLKCSYIKDKNASGVTVKKMIETYDYNLINK